MPEGVEMVMPGDNVQMSIELITPIAMDKGLRFAIREGGRTVGAGTVAEIVEDPLVTAVASPVEFTVATAGVLEAQAKDFPERVAPSASLAVA